MFLFRILDSLNPHTLVFITKIQRSKAERKEKEKHMDVGPH